MSARTTVRAAAPGSDQNADVTGANDLQLSQHQRALIKAFEDREPDYTDEQIDDALRRAADQLGSPVSHYDYDVVKCTGDPSWIRIIQRRRTWRRALVEAGLAVGARRGRQPTFGLDDCIAAVRRAAQEVGDEPLTYGRYGTIAQRLGLPSGQTVRNNVGRWSNALRIVGFR